MKIEKRTFLISGAASGLGRACAEDIVAHGGSVAVLDLDADAGAALAKQLGGGATARFFQTDVLETESIAAAVKGAVEWSKETGRPFGGVIPAAGVGFPGLILSAKQKPLEQDSFDLVMNINVRGTVDLVRQVLPHLAASPGDGPDAEHGVVVMVSSVAAFEGQMGQVAYAASKGAIASMALPMARDLSRFGVRVVAIAPSMFATKMTDMLSDKVRESLMRSMEFPKREGKPHEFAAMVTHAIENSMLNGVVIRLDGASRMPSRL